MRSAPNQPVYIATRGSALALAQANLVLRQLRANFPDRIFEIKIIKTTGDKLQTASLAHEGHTLPKGLFTKELETALLDGSADLAVHSLKDLPTELPDGLKLAFTPPREDVRDVLLFRGKGCGTGRAYGPKTSLDELPEDAVIATSSTRRRVQLLSRMPALVLRDIRGNVPTRLRKLAEQSDIDATILALAGLRRLEYEIGPEGELRGDSAPPGVLASTLDVEVMLPCVAQAAIGIETRVADERIESLVLGLNDPITFQCVTAERAFLAAMGGGCQSPVAAYAVAEGQRLRMQAASFVSGPVRRACDSAPLDEPTQLGRLLASRLRGTHK